MEAGWKSSGGGKCKPTICGSVSLERSGVALKASKVSWGFIMKASNPKWSVYTEHTVKWGIH